MVLFKTDRIAYSEPDSGCERATAYLTRVNGKPTPSKCLECPFPDCQWLTKDPGWGENTR